MSVKTYTCYFYPDGPDRIERKYWGVTLFASEGKGLTRHHAQLLIEKVHKNGDYEKIIAHFMGGGSSHSDDSNRIEGSWCSFFFGKIGRVEIIRNKKFSDHGEPIKESGHSETWIRKADDVRKMLKKIKKEQEDKFAYPQAFSLLGNRSKLAPKILIYRLREKCVQTAYIQDKNLLMNIFGEAQKIETSIRNFSSLAYSVHQNNYGVLRTKIGSNRLKKIWNNAVIPFAFLAMPFDHKLASEIAENTLEWEKQRKNSDLEKYLEIKALAKQAIDAFCPMESSYPVDDATLMADDQRSNVVLDNILSFIEVSFVERDSCCTWAMKKLESIDVTVHRLNEDLIITDTRNYLESDKKCTSEGCTLLAQVTKEKSI